MTRFTLALALSAGLAGAATLAGPAAALDAQPYVGNWAGVLGDGKTVALSVPAGVASGEPVGYSFGGEDQGPQAPSVQGRKLRLDNPSGTTILLGPVKGGRMTFFWTNGSKSTTASLTRQ